jgi:signal transduction histidine kinase
MKIKNRKPFWIGIKGKTIISILIIGTVPVLLSLGFIYYQGTSELRSAIGANFEGLAKETARKVDLIIGREIERHRLVAQSREVRNTIKKANQAYEKMSVSAVLERLSHGEENWRLNQESVSIQKPFIGVKDTHLLEDFIRHNVENPAYISFQITDEKGALVASTSRYSDYRNANKTWWRMAYALGGKETYVGDLYFHEKANIYTIDMAMAITEKGYEEPVGILKVEYNIQEFLKPSIHPIRFGKTGHAMLIDSAGDVIICPILATGNHVADTTLVNAVTSPEPGWVIAAGDGHGGKNSLVGFSPLESFNNLLANQRGNRWYSFIRQDPKELYVPVQNLLKWIAFSGILGLAVLSVSGFYLVNWFVTPIRKLQEGTRLIAEGKLNGPLNIHTGDEIEHLADDLDEMNLKLREAFSGLEHKVEERTKELQEAQEKLLQSEKLASMGQVAASIGHELRNPLNVIKNAAYYLKMKIKDDPKINKHLDIIDGEIASSEKIVADLLSFTRTSELVMTVRNLHRLLDEILSINETPPGIVVVKNFDSQLTPIQIDYDQIRRVFINIIHNSFQAMDNSGKLEIMTQNNEGSVEVVFADTGKGISPDNLKKLFQPFFTTKAKGIGLGLSVSKKIIEQHNGRIDVKSELGKGTTFTVTLPIIA